MQRFDKSVVFYWKRQDMKTTTQHRNEMGQSVIQHKQSVITKICCKVSIVFIDIQSFLAIVI